MRRARATSSSMSAPGIGEFTLWCADAGARVVAFEPDPLAFACLEKNIAVAARACRSFPMRCGRSAPNLRLHGSLDTTESSLIEDGKANARNADVEAWPLDQLQFMVAPAGHRLHEDRRGGGRAGDHSPARRARCAARASSRSTSAPPTGGRISRRASRRLLDALNFRTVAARPERHDPGAEHRDGRAVQ